MTTTPTAGSSPLTKRRCTPFVTECSGSAADADDALQEALLRAWRGLRRFEGRSSLRTWLYMIATNSCLKMLSRHDKRFLPVDYGPSVGPEGSPGQAVEGSLWVEPHLGLRQGDHCLPSPRTVPWLRPRAAARARRSLKP